VNQDILQGQWKQLMGHARQRWGKLTDDDVAQIKGDSEVLMGKIQEYYGRTREQALHDLEEWVAAERATR
jgi:uncharacterized protein YjbJ (UPF0337 family)